MASYTIQTNEISTRKFEKWNSKNYPFFLWCKVCVNIHQNKNAVCLKILKTEIPFLSRQKNEDEVASEYLTV